MSKFSTNEECWLTIPNYEDFYDVSSYGRVRSIDRIIQHRDGRLYPYKGKILKLNIRHDGKMPYPSIILCKDRKKTRFSVHTLVLITFVGPRPPNKEARHLDNNPQNNHWSNLIWATHIENESDKKLFGTHYQSKKTHCPYDHILKAPNLNVTSATKNCRKCLTCERTHAEQQYAIQNGRPFNAELAATRHYNKIMSY